MEYNLSQVTEDWNLPIDPAGYAFSIWGLIYFLLALFTIYQAIPADWIEALGGRRNDEMIFVQMNAIFIVNALCNAAWLPFFQSNTHWGFIVGWVLIVGIWLTNTALMVISQRNESWWLEVLMVRLPFSVYSGWVTGATVLNTAYMLKSWGMADDPNRIRPLAGVPSIWNFMSPLMFISEEEWTCIALWMVEVFFEIVSWWERNPAWGSVFTWASTAILVNNVENKQQNTTLIPNVATIVGVHAISMLVLFVYLVFEELQPWYEPLSFWNGGLFGLVDWSVAFQDIRMVLEYPEEYLYSLTEREAVA